MNFHDCKNCTMLLKAIWFRRLLSKWLKSSETMGNEISPFGLFIPIGMHYPAKRSLVIPEGEMFMFDDIADRFVSQC